MEIIMKKKAFIIAVILCFLAFSACDERKDERKTENQTDFQETTTPRDETDVKDGFKRIEYNYDSVINNFDLGQITPEKDLHVTIDIPDYLIAAVETENCDSYVRYVKDTNYTTRAFEILNAFKVDGDFVMDETIHTKSNLGHMTTNHHKYEISKGTTDLGYDYVLYEDSNDGYFIYIYVRVADNYILAFNYSDTTEHCDLVKESFNSIRLSK